jgi:hypothetical protein
MCLLARIRTLITALVLASYSPVGLAIGHESPDSAHGGHLALSLFTGRRTRVAASQQFEVASRVCVSPAPVRAAPASHAPLGDVALISPVHRTSGHTHRMSGVPTSSTSRDSGAPRRA